MAAMLLYLLTGSAAGLLGGLFGVGGGIVVVPALASIFRADQLPEAMVMHLAVGTSLASIIANASASTWAHHRRGAVLWPVVASLAPGLTAGALAGGGVARFLPTGILRWVFAVFVMLAGGQLALGKRPPANRKLPRRRILTLVGGTIGFISALAGVGGGTLTGPFLLWCNVALPNAIATSAACALPIAIAGTASFAISGWDTSTSVAYSLGFVHTKALAAIAPAIVICAPIGATLAHRLPIALLRRLFGILLVGVAIKMLMM